MFFDMNYIIINISLTIPFLSGIALVYKAIGSNVIELLNSINALF